MTTPVRSLRNKLALLFFAIVAAALGLIYFIVVPELEQNLEREQMSDLRRVARGAEPALEALIDRGDARVGDVDRQVRSVADATRARVTLLSVQRSDDGDVAFFPLTDSREERDVPENEPLARRAVRANRLQTGFQTFQGERLGQVAQPLDFAEDTVWVALYSRSFEDVADTVSLVRDRVLAASAVALVLALVGGWLVAQTLARRVRRLERGARAVSEGRFMRPLPVTSSD